MSPLSSIVNLKLKSLTLIMLRFFNSIDVFRFVDRSICLYIFFSKYFVDVWLSCSNLNSSQHTYTNPSVSLKIGFSLEHVAIAGRPSDRLCICFTLIVPFLNARRRRCCLRSDVIGYDR